MRQQRCAFVELQPAHAAMVLEIFPDARFIYTEMLGEFFLQVRALAAPAPASQQIPDPDAQRLTRFRVVVGRLVCVRDDENAGASRSFVRLINRVQRTCQKAAELGLELRHA